MQTIPNLGRPWYRRLAFRISIRRLIVLVLVIGGGLGWIVHRAGVQCAAVAAIRRAGGKVDYNLSYKSLRSGLSPAPPRPRWVADYLGIDFVSHVTQVRIGTKPNSTVFGDAVFATVGPLDHLEVLSISDNDSTENGLAQLRNLTRMKDLTILGGHTSGDSFRHFSPMTQLERLQFDLGTAKDDDLALLTGLTQLRSLSLNFRNSVNLTAAGLAHIARLQDLQSLQLNGTEINDDGLAQLGLLHRLMELSLDGSEITSSGLANLAGLGKLESLSVRDSEVTSLAQLRPLAAFRNLDFRGAPIDDKGLKPLAEFLNLDSLILSGNTAMTDAGLESLQGNPSLTHLDLSGTKISDAGLLYLVGCPRLDMLYLGGTLISKAGFATLMKMPTLKTLIIPADLLNAAEIQAVKAAKPGTSIFED